MNQPVIGFVGKLIVSKGPDLLLAAWPLVLVRHPGAGSSSSASGLTGRRSSFSSVPSRAADEHLLSRIIRYGRALEGGERNQLTYLRAFFESSRPPLGAILRGCAQDAREHRLHGAPGARRARSPHAGCRECADAEHVP